jgi:hypothetical protein
MTRNLQPNPEIKVTIELKFKSKLELDAVVKALIPDNINFPEGLSLNMLKSNLQKNVLILKFSSDKISPDTITSTIDEMLEHIYIATQVIGK